MSIKVMSHVWENEALDPYERLVMLSLADHADDDGNCYPSIGRVCRRTGMKERGVQNVIKRLSERGYISIEKNAGPRGTNRYKLRATPASDAPRTECAPASDAPVPPHPITCTPASDAPETSKNHHLNVKEDRFDAFWSGWPNKVAKEAARKAWRKLSQKDREAAIEKRDEWFAYWRARHRDASPIHASTYLNQKRWQDEAVPSSNDPQQGGDFLDGVLRRHRGAA